jgi:hypothetical protein
MGRRRDGDHSQAHRRRRQPSRASRRAGTYPTRSYQAAEVSEALHRSTKWVYRHADELGAIRIGRAVIFPRHRIDAIAGERAA